MIEVDLYNQLKNDTAIIALVGTRIYPIKAPQNVVSPYLIYHVIIGKSKQCIEGSVYQKDTRFQVDCWSKIFAKSVELREAVEESIIGFKSSYNINSMPFYEDETQLYNEILDFKLKG